MRVLHITNWYPNYWNPHETPFIKEHFNAASCFGDHQLWHIQVRNEGDLFSIHRGKYENKQSYLILDTRIKVWRLIEFFSFFLLFWLRIKQGKRWWDVVHVHIAYPLLRYKFLFRLLYGKNIILTEHWSAYRRGFSLAAGSKSKKRIQGIFHSNIPVITVSRALMDDIVRFAETDGFPQHVVPNVVDTSLFYPTSSSRKGDDFVFLMVASWAPIKQPFLILQAFKSILKSYPNAKLRIVGFGVQWADMEKFIQVENLANSIVLLGAMGKTEIANEMRNTNVFLHASKYETFSVVCAEALCCGVPVIVSNVGAISELINESNGILVENTNEAWCEALQYFLQGKVELDREEISKDAAGKFNPRTIGKRLNNIFMQHAKNSNICF
jgi:glycosyltransferase involved in cell wall biosynthesis